MKRGVRIVRGDVELQEKLGRNDLCVCGSGADFKKCCMRSGRFDGSQRDDYFQGVTLGALPFSPRGRRWQRAALTDEGRPGAAGADERCSGIRRRRRIGMAASVSAPPGRPSSDPAAPGHLLPRGEKENRVAPPSPPRHARACPEHPRLATLVAGTAGNEALTRSSPQRRGWSGQARP
ncbi:MAG: SEC-C domain-containing protein [Beijerinckiaceae bacterium]|nr:SEC-C domain-containing protein [Beijerinckiaceae bacterium]